MCGTARFAFGAFDLRESRRRAGATRTSGPRTLREEHKVRGVVIRCGELPRTIDIEEGKGCLDCLQELVGGPIEPLDGVFGQGVTLYVNENGLGSLEPNRAVVATREMEDAGYVSQMDFRSAVREGDVYTVLFGDVVAVGFDEESGEDRDLTDAELARVTDYFEHVSCVGSGEEVVFVVKLGLDPTRMYAPLAGNPPLSVQVEAVGRDEPAEDGQPGRGDDAR